MCITIAFFDYKYSYEYHWASNELWMIGMIGKEWMESNINSEVRVYFAIHYKSQIWIIYKFSIFRNDNRFQSN